MNRIPTRDNVARSQKVLTFQSWSQPHVDPRQQRRRRRPYLILSTIQAPFSSSPSCSSSLHSTAPPQPSQSGAQLHGSFASQSLQHAVQTNHILSLYMGSYKPLLLHPTILLSPTLCPLSKSNISPATRFQTGKQLQGSNRLLLDSSPDLPVMSCSQLGERATSRSQSCSRTHSRCSYPLDGRHLRWQR